MSSEADLQSADGTRVVLLDRLRERLEQIAELSTAMQRALKRTDVAAIDEAATRLETLALEFKLLAAEYRRLPEPDGDSPDLQRARGDLEQTAMRLARSAAVGGGLLERLVAVTRQLVHVIDAAVGETYLPSGRTRERDLDGMRLREQA